jgi:hypothetical protein
MALARANLPGSHRVRRPDAVATTVGAERGDTSEDFVVMLSV